MFGVFGFSVPMKTQTGEGTLEKVLCEMCSGDNQLEAGVSGFPTTVSSCFHPCPFQLSDLFSLPSS